MTHTEQNIACAVLEGWTSICVGYDGILSGITPDKLSERAIPDYANDLNACSRLFAKLQRGQKGVCVDFLCVSTKSNHVDDVTALIMVTAPQFCEAILLATGRWKHDDPPALD